MTESLSRIKNNPMKERNRTSFFPNNWTNPLYPLLDNRDESHLDKRRRFSWDNIPTAISTQIIYGLIKIFGIIRKSIAFGGDLPTTWHRAHYRLHSFQIIGGFPSSHLLVLYLFSFRGLRCSGRSNILTNGPRMNKSIQSFLKKGKLVKNRVA